MISLGIGNDDDKIPECVGGSETDFDDYEAD